MRNDLSMAFDECLARMKQGADMEACMTEYPNLQQQLEPLLETAVAISDAPKAVPSGEFRRVSKARLLSRIRESSVHAREERSRPATPFGRLGSLLGAAAEAVLPSNGVTVPVASALLVALAAVFIVYSVFSFLPQHSALASQCTVSVLSGDVQVQNPGSDIWHEAEDGMVLEEGTRVKTSPNSNALLTFFEGSTIELEPGTDVEVERIVDGGGQSTEIVMKQWLGRTWSRVVKKADPGSRYEIQTPSAYALVRGTLFEVEVDEAGSTTVRTIEGLVSVGAQGEEVNVPAGQTTSVEIGATPSQPSPIPVADSELVITVSMPAVASVCDPTGASTGYLPSGLAFSQIIGSQSSSPTEGDQVIRVPQPVPGLYSVILRGVGSGTSTVGLERRFGGETVFVREDSYEVADGSEWLLKVSLEFEEGQLSGVSVSDIEPLTDQAHGKVVITGSEGASLVPIRPPQEPEETPEPAVTKHFSDLTVARGTGGVVTSPGEGHFTYDTGTVVELVAVPDQGYDFVNWAGDVADPLSPVTTISMNQDEEVTAKFAKRTHVLSVIKNGGGKVTEPGQSISLHRTGAVVTLVAVPDPGWEFVSWSGNVADPTSPVTTITMSHLEVVTASFVPRN